MNDNFINLKDQETLYSVQDYLRNISVESTIMEASKDLPYNLLVAITEELISVNIMYVPLPEDQFSGIRLLQFYSLVVTEVGAERKKDFPLLLNEINLRSPLGTFSINEKGELGFKYIFPVDRFEMLKQEFFTDIFSLYLNCLQTFRETLSEVNNGTLSVSAASKKVNTD